MLVRAALEGKQAAVHKAATATQAAAVVHRVITAVHHEAATATQAAAVIHRGKSQENIRKRM